LVRGLGFEGKRLMAVKILRIKSNITLLKYQAILRLFFKVPLFTVIIRGYYTFFLLNRVLSFLSKKNAILLLLVKAEACLISGFIHTSGT